MRAAPFIGLCVQQRHIIVAVRHAATAEYHQKSVLWDTQAPFVILFDHFHAHGLVDRLAVYVV